MNTPDTPYSPWNKCGVFLINLDRSPERLALATENFAKIGMPFQRVAGFDASKEDVPLNLPVIECSAFFNKEKVFINFICL
jgi:hypothetical protein